MASPQKTAETGTAQAPRSCNGSVRAARPLGVLSLGGLKPIRRRGLVRVDPNQRPEHSLFFARRTARTRLDFGLLGLSQYRLDPKLARTFVQRGGC